jgi:hypothetical protein
MTENLERLPAIARQDGRIYQPRKIVAEAVSGEDEILTGVMVLGTHDPERALPLAADYIRWQLGRGYRPVYKGGGWWRDGFEGGRRVWLTDERRGRAGVWFGIEEGDPQLAAEGV